MGRDAVICEPIRTPIGRYGGMFKSLSAVELGVAAVNGLLERTGIAPAAVEDVILGHCYPSMEAPAIGRVVALDAGLPVTVPGMQLDRRCGSGLQAVIQACMQVITVPLHGHALGWSTWRGEGARRTEPRADHGGRPGPSGARRHDRDG
jgi:acetyl-CoA acetyltransferase